MSDKSIIPGIRNRFSNFELLRVIATLMIIAGHLGGQGFDEVINSGRIFITLFSNGSRIAVNLFLMIGCWFMLDVKFKAERVLKIYSTLWFYSVFLTLIVVVTGNTVGLVKFVSAFFPFIRRGLWFISSYLVLILLSPFLQKIFERSKEYIERLLMILFLLICIVCTLSTMMDTYLCTIVWFIFIYFAVGYYKKFLYDNLNGKSIYLIIGVGLYILMVITRLICQNLTGTIFDYGDLVLRQCLGDYKSLLNFICSATIFIFFSKLDIGNNKLVNSVASNTLDVYIIHQVPAFYPVLWKCILKTNQWGTSDYFGIFYFATILIVFIGGTAIGKIRCNTLEPLWTKTKIFRWICRKIDRFYVPICSIVSNNAID